MLVADNPDAGSQEYEDPLMVPEIFSCCELPTQIDGLFGVIAIFAVVSIVTVAEPDATPVQFASLTDVNAQADVVVGDTVKV